MFGPNWFLGRGWVGSDASKMTGVASGGVCTDLVVHDQSGCLLCSLVVVALAAVVVVGGVKRWLWTVKVEVMVAVVVVV